MERMNREIRDREIVVHGLKTTDTPILKDYQLFHNYIRPHEALDGKTPSEDMRNTNRRKKQVDIPNAKCQQKKR